MQQVYDHIVTGRRSYYEFLVNHPMHERLHGARTTYRDAKIRWNIDPADVIEYLLRPYYLKAKLDAEERAKFMKLLKLKREGVNLLA